MAERFSRVDAQCRCDAGVALGLFSAMSGLALLATLFLVPSSVLAQPSVNSVDWVQGRSEVPHPALENKPVYLQAVAEGGGCNGNYSYRWDLNGDGDFGDGGEGWTGADVWGPRNGWFAPVGREYTFPNQPGDRLFYPRVEVRCSWGGPVGSVVVPYLLRKERMCGGYPPGRAGHHHSDMHCNADENDNPKLTKNYINDWGVDRALWWMFNRINHYGDDGRGNGVHSCTYHGWQSTYSLGHVLNAFLRRSHGGGPDAESDVYYRHATQCGLHALLGTYDWSCNIGWDDCARGRCRCRMYHNGARVSMGGNWMAYGSTAWSEPLAGFGNPAYVSPRHGHNLRGIAQDVADGLVYCQGGNGGWYYSCGGNGGDGSTNGWAPEGLRLMKRKYDANTYGWARDRQRNWLRGNCWNSCHYHGGGWKLGGNALVGWGWVREENFDWNAENDQMRNHYHAVSGGDHYHWGSYYMYATTKGLRSWVPELKYMNQGSQQAAETNINGRDWSGEFAEFLMSWQSGDGSFEWCWHGNHNCGHNWLGWSGIPRETITAIETQIVQTWLEAQALARANPQQTGPRIPVVFDHSWSYILDPSIKIVQYRWDKDSRNGVWWENGAAPDFESERCGNDDFDCQRRIRLSPYVFAYSDALGWDDVIGTRVTLQIRDSMDRFFTDDKSVEIQLSLKNHKPLIIAHPNGIDGVYAGYFGQPMLFDATYTWDADECIRDVNGQAVKGNCGNRFIFPGDGGRPQGQPDSISSICFDIDFDGNWCEANETAARKDGTTDFGGQMVEGRIGMLVFLPGDNLDEGVTVGIPVRACDDGRWNGKCYQPGDGGPGHLTQNDCSTCSYGTVSVNVIRNENPPEVVMGNPDPAPGVATVPINGIPGDEQTFSLTNANGDVTRFVFDHDSNAADGSTRNIGGLPHIVIGIGNALNDPVAVAARMETAINNSNAGVTAASAATDPASARSIVAIDSNPADEQTFTLTNAAGEATRFVFDHQSATTDGTTRVINGQPHVVVGLSGVLNDPTGIAGRLESAVNSADAGISAEDQGLQQTRATGTIAVTGDPADDERFEIIDAAGNRVYFVFEHDSATVDGTVRNIGQDAHVVIGLQGALGNPEEIARRIAIAMNNSDTPVLVSRDGSDINLTQSGIGAQGNTAIDMSAVTGLTGTDFTGGGDGPVVILTQADPGEAGNQPVDFSGVSGVGATPFAGGQNQAEVVLTQQGTGFSGNTVINMGGVDNVGSTNFGGGAAGPLTTIPGQPIQLDFSDSIDPEGVFGFEVDSNGVFFLYDLPQGGGRILPTPGYEGRADNLGPRPIFIPDVDGVRNVTIRVTATDAGGMEAVQEIEIQIQNEPPVVESFGVRFAARPPILDDQISLSNRGNRRYRMTVDANPDPGWNGFIDYVASEPFGEPITIRIDMDGDGINDLEGNQPQGSLGAFVYREGAVDLPVTVTADDGEGTSSLTQVVQVPPIPADAFDLRYFIDIDNDGVFEAVNDRDNFLEFIVVPGQLTVRITGHVSANGFEVPFDTGDMPLPNSEPIIDAVRVVSLEGFDVVLQTAGHDNDADPLTYIIDWGDGSPPNRTIGTVSRHRFPEGRYERYIVTVTLEDGRGGEDVETVAVEILEPEIIRADLDALRWERVTAPEGLYDGVRGFDVGPTGTLFTHNYLDEVRRSTDNGETWDLLLEDIECCGAVATRDDGQVFVASPGGLYYSDNDGNDWAIWAENKFKNVIISPDRNFVIGLTDTEIRRYDMTGGLEDVHLLQESPLDLAVCETGNRAAVSTERGRLLINDHPSLAPAGWLVPDQRFGKGQGESSVAFDTACNLYQGLWNGYRTYAYPNGPVEPASSHAPNHMVHPAGYHKNTVNKGLGNITDILAWDDGPVLVGSERGIWGTNKPWNAHRKPYWKARIQGLDRSTVVRKFDVSPVSGHVFVAASTARKMPKYCRKNRNAGRRRRRRNRRGRVQFYYVFCGFSYNYQGGLYRSTEPILTSRIVGEGGADFNPLTYRGVKYDDDREGLVIGVDDNWNNSLWLPNTAGSSLSRWDITENVPVEIGRYRVGLPQGECPGECCWTEGCNMPSRMALDDEGSAYVASAGYGMQGSVTKVAGSLSGCVDRNGNEQINTSINEPRVDIGVGQPLNAENVRIQSLVNRKCSTAGCHTGEAEAGGLDLTNLLGLVGEESSIGMPYVTAGSRQQSYLYHKIAGTFENVGGAGERMPQGQEALSNEELLLIRDWIEGLDDDNLDANRRAQSAAIMNYGEDECILWTSTVGPVDAQLRALAVDLGDREEPSGYIWVGAYSESRMYKLNPTDGRVMATVDLDVQPFAAAVGSDGTMWVGTLGDGELQSFNTRTGQVGPVIENPTALRDGCRSSYGLTIDPRGRVWMSGWECPDAIAFDPRVNDWCRISLPYDRVVGRGIAPDGRGTIWASLGGDEQSGIAWWSEDECVAGQTTELPIGLGRFRDSEPNTVGASGISADSFGRVWMTHYLSPSIMMINPRNAFQISHIEGTNQVFSFSDYTGLARHLAVGRGSYNEDMSAECEAPTWTGLTWDADLPNGTTITFEAQSAAERDKLDEADIVPLAIAPAEQAPVNVTGALGQAGEASLQFLRIRAVLKKNTDGVSPALRRISVFWSCNQ